MLTRMRGKFSISARTDSTKALPLSMIRSASRIFDRVTNFVTFRDTMLYLVLKELMNFFDPCNISKKSLKYLNKNSNRTAQPNSNRTKFSYLKVSPTNFGRLCKHDLFQIYVMQDRPSLSHFFKNFKRFFFDNGRRFPARVYVSLYLVFPPVEGSFAERRGFEK